MMKSLPAPLSMDILKTSSFVKITALALFSVTLLLFLFTRYSPTTNSTLTFFSSSSSSNATEQPHSPPLPSLPPPPAPGAKVFIVPTLPTVEFMGVVDGNGVMTGDFKIGDFDPGLVEDLLNSSDSREAKEGGVVRAKIERYKMCDMKMVDYIPCLDNAEAIQKLNSSVRGEKYERHCPEEGKGLNCLVPMPQGYKIPILWPKSRDEVLFGLGL